MKLRLFVTDFDTAMCHEDRDYLYIVKSVDLPTEEEILNTLYKMMWSGTIYLNSFKEVTEKEIRYHKKYIREIGA